MSEPTVYLVNAPLANSALPGDHLVCWGDDEWTLQRQVSPPLEIDTLKPLGYSRAELPAVVRPLLTG